MRKDESFLLRRGGLPPVWNFNALGYKLSWSHLSCLLIAPRNDARFYKGGKTVDVACFNVISIALLCYIRPG